MKKDRLAASFSDAQLENVNVRKRTKEIETVRFLDTFWWVFSKCSVVSSCAVRCANTDGVRVWPRGAGAQAV